MRCSVATCVFVPYSLLKHSFSLLLRNICNLLSIYAELLKCNVILVKIRLHEFKNPNLRSFNFPNYKIYILITPRSFFFSPALIATRIYGLRSFKIQMQWLSAYSLEPCHTVIETLHIHKSKRLGLCISF